MGSFFFLRTSAPNDKNTNPFLDIGFGVNEGTANGLNPVDRNSNEEACRCERCSCGSGSISILIFDALAGPRAERAGREGRSK